MSYDVIVVGAGLSGLSCAVECALNNRKVLVLEAHPYIGGRTSSFYEQGMHIESGLHRFIGYYTALPALLKACGVSLDDVITWEEKIDILIKNENQKYVLGVAPIYGPLKLMRSILGSNDILTFKDKGSLLPFFFNGLKDFVTRPQELDQMTIKEYAKIHKVSGRAYRFMLEPLSSGLFFLPPDHYSAYVLFGMLAPAVQKFYKMRIGAFLGGMTEVMCNPIADKLKSLGGQIQCNERVEHIIYDDLSGATGVIAENGRVYRAKHIVIATPLTAAQKILKPFHSHKEFKNFFALPAMSAATIQIELDRPALKKDITTFGPGTDMVCFAEQSRTTFRHSKGRLSIILGNPNNYEGKSAEDTLKNVIKDAESLGIRLTNHIVGFRKVNHHQDFHSLDKGVQFLRPEQKTSIKGLTLAGDYTRTPYFATMEGAVVSGKKAADLIINSK